MKDGMMKALVFKGPKHFEVEERPIPACGPDEILVRVRYGGVCGTDNRIYQGTKIIEAPRITGHCQNWSISFIKRRQSLLWARPQKRFICCWD